MKGPQFVRIDPPGSIKFEYDETHNDLQEVSTTITLINLSDTHKVFKIKSNRPKMYGVVPNQGVIPALGKEEIQFGTKMKNIQKDRFQILVAELTENSKTDFKLLWRDKSVTKQKFLLNVSLKKRQPKSDPLLQYSQNPLEQSPQSPQKSPGKFPDIPDHMFQSAVQMPPQSPYQEISDDVFKSGPLPKTTPLANYQQQVQKFVHENTYLKESNEKVLDANRELEIEVQKLRHDLEDTHSKLQMRQLSKRQKQTQEIEYENVILALRNKCSAAELQRDDLMLSCGDLKVQVGEKDGQILEAQALQEEYRQEVQKISMKLQEHDNRSNQRYQQFEQTIAMKEEQLGEFQMMISTKNQELTDRITEVARLQGQVNDLEQTQMTLKEEVSSQVQMLNDARQSSEDQMNTLQSSLMQEFNEEKAQMRMDHAETMAQAQLDLREQITQEQEELSLQKALQQQRDRSQTQQDIVERLKEQHDKERGTITQLQGTISELKAQTKDQEKEIKRLKKEAKTVSKDAKKALADQESNHKQKISVYEKNIKKLNSSLSSLEKKVKDVETKNSNHEQSQKKYQSLEKVSNARATEISNLKKKVAKLLKEAKEAQAQSTSQNEIQKLEEIQDELFIKQNKLEVKCKKTTELLKVTQDQLKAEKKKVKDLKSREKQTKKKHETKLKNLKNQFDEQSKKVEADLKSSSSSQDRMMLIKALLIALLSMIVGAYAF